MSALAALPLAAPVFRLIAGEDWLDAVMYADQDGAPLAIDDIAFTLTLTPRGGSSPVLTASTATGTILTAGAVLQISVPAGALSDLTAGAYLVAMTGQADGLTIALFSGRLTLGAI